MGELWIVSCVLLAVGFCCTAAGAVWKFALHRTDRYEGHAEARVVDIVTKPRGGQASLSEFRNNRVAVFEFFADGRLVKVSDTADTYPCPYRMNQKVSVCYDPADPERFEVETADIKLRIADAVRLFGITFAVAGCALFLLYAARVDI